LNDLDLGVIPPRSKKLKYILGERPSRFEKLKCQKKRGEYTITKPQINFFIKIDNNCKGYIVVDNLSFYKI